MTRMQWRAWACCSSSINDHLLGRYRASLSSVVEAALGRQEEGCSDAGALRTSASVSLRLCTLPSSLLPVLRAGA
ncbi:hypothetical protein WJX84_011365 [Apatococcus fuscideae]|uniref:Uncharacterized protein n=1 Tax=Apatococcus fuscideae TaxID=2026836 RepID=A0AAW1SU22_9CHLO